MDLAGVLIWHASIGMVPDLHGGADRTKAYLDAMRRLIQ